MSHKLLPAAVAVAFTFLTSTPLTLAQRPASTSICDYYSAALLNSTNATSQQTLLTLLVNTAVIGNYTLPNHNAVPGILSANSTYNGTAVNLLPYFDGGLASTNQGGKKGVSVNFLDGGGAKPLMKNLPAEAMGSNQYRLLTHLYAYFGLLLNCSSLGQTGFPAYAGDTGMYAVHKFMHLDAFQVGYFIEQVGLSAASFGVSAEDVATVGGALQEYFGHRCAAPVDIVPGKKPQLQAVCLASDCPKAPNATCAAYHHAQIPMTASSGSPTTSSSMQTGSSSDSSASMGGMTGTGGASQLAASFGLMMAAAVFGLVKVLA